MKRLKIFCSIIVGSHFVLGNFLVCTEVSGLEEILMHIFNKLWIGRTKILIPIFCHGWGFEIIRKTRYQYQNYIFRAPKPKNRPLVTLRESPVTLHFWIHVFWSIRNTKVFKIIMLLRNGYWNLILQLKSSTYDIDFGGHFIQILNYEENPKRFRKVSKSRKKRRFFLWRYSCGNNLSQSWSFDRVMRRLQGFRTVEGQSRKSENIFACMKLI